MATRWTEIPIDAKLFTNVDPTSNTRTLTGLENCFVSEAGSHSRFPGLIERVNFGDSDPVYLKEYEGDLVAVTSKGRFYRIGSDYSYEDVTAVPVAGGRRPVFAETDDGMIVAAGGPIVRFSGQKTELLSEDAPKSTHVAYIDSYVVAVELDSGRFQHADAGQIDIWDPLSVFSADGKPDDLNGLFVTPYRELLLTGPQSIEQFERLQSGDTPFFRRWSVGEGVMAPYTLTFADNATWAVNQDREFTRYSGQTAVAGSGDVQVTLDAVDDWTDAWADRINVKGQTFVVLQMPHATTEYGTKGLTLLFDVRQRKWGLLYGWDAAQGLPTRWPGWSHEYHRVWKKNLVGGDGKIYELTPDAYDHAGAVQRLLGRTAHVGHYEFRCDNLRLTCKRGVGTNETAPEILLRCNRDNRGFGPWKRKSLGRYGDRMMTVEFGGFGCGHHFQFEWMVTDACEVEIRKLEWQTTPLGE